MKKIYDAIQFTNAEYGLSVKITNRSSYYCVADDILPMHTVELTSNKYIDDDMIADMVHHITTPYYEKPIALKVIFNDPATIVFWSDGTKTVCKAVKGDKFDAEKGLAMCYFKKFARSEIEYFKALNKAQRYNAKYEKPKSERTVQDVIDSMTEEQKKVLYYLVDRALKTGL